MKVHLTILVFLFLIQGVAAQNTVPFEIRGGDEDGVPLAGAIVHITGTEISVVADSNGRGVLKNIPDGKQTIEVSMVGYFKWKSKFSFPFSDPKFDSLVSVTFVLKPQVEEIDEVIVSSTRNYQKPEYLPTRVEVITEEEVEERSHDKPSDMSHVVREQPGVQVQRTSATAGTMNIRLQGLKGRYVQILKDGFPLFGGFSNVLGITQIPPLDLKQVEIIKGPSSTLYGGDAIAGVINLISKTPNETPVYDIMFNGESLNAYDAGVYAAQKFNWFAFSLSGIYRLQSEKDLDNDHFTEIPKLQRYSVSPQLFFDITKHAKLNIGGSYTDEMRLSGTVEYIHGKGDSVYNYFEKNISKHVTTNLKFEYDLEESGKLTVRNAFNYFSRGLNIPYNDFWGEQFSSLTELNYRFIKKRHDVVVGIDLRHDSYVYQFCDSLFPCGPAIDRVPWGNTYLTFGAFAQYIYNFSDKTTVEGGLRIDYNNIYKVYPLPHVGFRQKWNEIFTTRLNIGMGYKLPTIFQDESEEARFINVLPVTKSIKPELSLGGTLDLKVKLPNFNGLNVSINQLYFLTHIFKPLLANSFPDTSCHLLDCNQLQYTNANGYNRSGGVETGVNLSYRGFGFSLIYTLTDNNRQINNVRSIAPLTSKHIVTFLAGYEIKNFSIGLDAYYFSPVKLSDGSVGKQIWEVGINLQYAYKYFILFANFENLADIRQTTYGRVVFPDPTYSHPRFAEIYAPLEGRLINAGFKIHMGAFSKKNKSSEAAVEKLRRKDE